MNWSIEHAVSQLQTPVGFTLAATAGIGATLAVHWPPLLAFMVPLYLVTLCIPRLARQSLLWSITTAIWIVVVVVQRSEMEDHVYLWVAWTLAIAIALADLDTFVASLGRIARLLIGVVFVFGTFWKLTSGSFLSGAALWTLGLHDSRLGPLFRVAGISQESFDQARVPLNQVATGQVESFAIELSSYSTAALLFISLGTVALEALVAVTHLAPNTTWLARLRVPTILIFGVVTYSIVPVLAFAALLAVMSLTIVDFDRRARIGLAVMFAIALVRFVTI